jgi:hypothetical protein
MSCDFASAGLYLIYITLLRLQYLTIIASNSSMPSTRSHFIAEKQYYANRILASHVKPPIKDARDEERFLGNRDDTFTVQRIPLLRRFSSLLQYIIFCTYATLPTRDPSST